MFYPNDYVIRLIKEQEMRERIREARVHQMINEIQPHRPSRIKQITQMTLHSLGRLLVSVGKQLERVETRDARLAPR